MTKPTKAMIDAIIRRHHARRDGVERNKKRLNGLNDVMVDMKMVSRDPGRLGIAYQQLVMAHALILAETVALQNRMRKVTNKYPELKDVD
jgi:hypothetical protein